MRGEALTVIAMRVWLAILLGIWYSLVGCGRGYSSKRSSGALQSDGSSLQHRLFDRIPVVGKAPVTIKLHKAAVSNDDSGAISFSFFKLIFSFFSRHCFARSF